MSSALSSELRTRFREYIEEGLSGGGPFEITCGNGCPLAAQVARDGDITLPELAEALASATGVVAHAASIGRFLRKLGYTYKKSHWSRPSGCAHG